MKTLHEHDIINATNLGFGSINDDIQTIVTEELDGIFELEMTYPIEGKRYKDLMLRRQIFAKPNPFDKPQLFRIFEITKPIDGIVTVFAYHISYDQNGYPVNEFTANNLAIALEKINSYCEISSPWKFTTDKDDNTTMETTIVKSIRSILRSNFKERYKKEYKFDNYTTHLLTKRGMDRSVYIRYGKNLTDLKQDENCADVVTGVYPYWVGTDYETDKRIIKKLPEKIVKVPGTFNFVKVIPYDVSSDLYEEPTEEELREATNKYISDNKLGEPKVALDVSFTKLTDSGEYETKAKLEQVELGDTVHVEFNELGVNSTARCIRTTYDVNNDEYIELTLGEARSNLANGITSSNSDLSNQITAQEGKFEATIGTIKIAMADIEYAIIEKADIKDLNAVTATVGSLMADVAHINTAIIDVAYITDLTAMEAKVTNLIATKADIEQLNATNAIISNVEIETANIKNLLAGNISSEQGQIINLTVDNVRISDAVIKDLIATRITVGDLIAGNIDTNKFTISSSDGGISIVGATQQFKDKNNKVRMQIGQDAKNNFNFILIGEDGTTTLIDHTGIKEKAIADGLIKESMVGDGQIGGKKINISSMVTEINNNASLIKGSKILLDTESQTLEVAFNSVKTTANNANNKIDNLQIGTRNLLKGTAKTKTITTNSPGGYVAVDAYGTTLSGDNTRGGKTFSQLGFVSGDEIYISFKWSIRQNGSLSVVKGTFTVEVAFDSTYKGTAKTKTITDNSGKFMSVLKLNSNTIQANQLRVRIDNSVLLFDINECMLEKGNKMSDWSPSPEDIVEVTESHTTELNIQNGKIDTLITDTTIIKDGQSVKLKDEYSKLEQTVGGIKQMVGSQTTAIDTLNTQVGNINGNIVTIDGKVNAVETAQSTINQTIRNITQRVEATESTTVTLQTNIDNIQIGGTNLLPDTNGNFGSKYYHGNSTWELGQSDPFGGNKAILITGTSSSDSFFRVLRDSMIIKEKGEHVLTIWLKANKVGYIDVKINANTFSKSCPLTTTWQKFEIKINVGTIYTNNHFIIGGWNTWTDTSFKVYLAFPMLEKGNKASEWSPSPIDIDDSINTINTSISTTNRKVSEIVTNLDSITQRVSSTETTTVNIQTNINNIKIGGSNILLDTMDFGFNNLSIWNFRGGSQENTSQTYKGCKVVRLYSQWARRTQTLDCDPNTEYTISAWVKAGNATTRIGAYCESAYYVSSSHKFDAPIGTSWVRFWCVMRTTNMTSMNMRIEPNMPSDNDLYICGVKIEKGNKATEWSPASSDILDTINTSVDNIKIGANNNINNGGFTRGISDWPHNVFTGNFGKVIVDESTAPSGKALKLTVSGRNQGVYQRNIVPVIEETEYTISLYAKASSNGHILKVSFEGDSSTDIPLTTSWKRYVYTSRNNPINWNRTAIFYSNSTTTGDIFIHSIKLEKGNKATDWTPSKTDIDNSINDVSIEVSTTKKQISEIITNMDSITQRVSATETATFTITNDLNSLQVGGRNLLRGTSNKKTITINNTSGYVVVDVYGTISSGDNTRGGKTFSQLGFSVGDSIAISFNWATRQNGSLSVVKGTFTVEVAFDSTFKGSISPSTAISGTSGKASFIHKLNSNTIQANQLRVRIDNSVLLFDVSECQIEKGNRPSDWTPAPEDTNDLIDGVQIGARNYALLSKSKTKTNFTNIANDCNPYFRVNVPKNAKVGETISVSYIFEYSGLVKGNGNSTGIRFQGSGDVTGWNSGCWIGSGRLDSLINWGSSSSGSFVVKYSFVLTSDHLRNSYWSTNFRSDYVSAGSYTIKELMVELSSKHSSWTPAPEDIENQFSTVETSITTSNEKISAIETNLSGVTTRVSTTEKSITTINGDISTINQRVATAEQKITDSAIMATVTSSSNWSSMNNKVDGKLDTTTATNTYVTKSSFTQESDKIVAKFESSGGINLLKNSGAKSSTSFWSLFEYNITGSNLTRAFNTRNDSWTNYQNAFQLNIYNMTNGEYGFRQSFKTVIGQKYVFTCYLAGHRSNKKIIIRGTTDSAGGWLVNQNYGHINGGTVLSDWTKVVIPFTAQRDTTAVQICITSTIGDSGFLWAKDLMISEGDNWKPWTPNPSEIYEGSTVIDANGVTVKNGALTIENKSGIKVLQGDTYGNITINGVFANNNSAGIKGVEINNANIYLYDWEKQSRELGIIYSSKLTTHPNCRGLTIAHSNDSYSILAYKKSDGTYGSYAILDKNQTNPNYQSPINIFEGTVFRDTVNMQANAFVSILRFNTLMDYPRMFKDANTNRLVTQVSVTNSREGMLISSNTGSALFRIEAGSSYPTIMGTSTMVSGNFSVTGSKNSLQKTEHYGDRLINAYETADYYFGDLGFGVINNDGECYISIDDIFNECVNTKLEYHVFTQKYNGDVCSIDRFETYFIVKGVPGTKFSWEIKAKRKGYEQYRLETEEITDAIDRTAVFEDDDIKPVTSESTLNDLLDYDLTNILLSEEEQP